MKCMRNLRQFHVTFATDCSQLVKIVSEPHDWPAFATYLEEIKNLKSSFTHSAIIHISRRHNTTADRLAQSARKQPSFISLFMLMKKNCTSKIRSYHRHISPISTIVLDEMVRRIRLRCGSVSIKQKQL